LLTPIGLDPAHPFPLVVNKSLNFVIELSGKDAFGRETNVAIVKAPRLLPRIIALPTEVAGADNTFVMLSSVIHAHLDEMFEGRDIIAYPHFRGNRHAALCFDEEVKNRGRRSRASFRSAVGLAVRLEVVATCCAPRADPVEAVRVDRTRSLPGQRTGESCQDARAD
jgi:polyphosphate kinase